MNVINAIAEGRRWVIRNPVVRWPLLAVAFTYLCVDSQLGTQGSVLGLIALALIGLLMPWRRAVGLIDSQPIIAGVFGVASVAGVVWAYVIADDDDVIASVVGGLSGLILICWTLTINMRSAEIEAGYEDEDDDVEQS